MYNSAMRCRWAIVLVPTLGRAESRWELENRALWLLCLGGTTSTLEVDKVEKVHIYLVRTLLSLPFRDVEFTLSIGRAVLFDWYLL
jgi:hypothetical protein